jgi:hypothetical protein
MQQFNAYMWNSWFSPYSSVSHRTQADQLEQPDRRWVGGRAGQPVQRRSVGRTDLDFILGAIGVGQPGHPPGQVCAMQAEWDDGADPVLAEMTP